MGLTADLQGKWLYWLVRSYDGSELHRAPTADKITLDGNEVFTCITMSELKSYLYKTRGIPLVPRYIYTDF